MSCALSLSVPTRLPTRAFAPPTQANSHRIGALPHIISSKKDEFQFVAGFVAVQSPDDVHRIASTIRNPIHVGQFMYRIK